MLSDFGLMVSTMVGLLQFEITVFGFTFSFWQVLLFNMVAGIVVWILSEVFFL